MQSRIKLTVSHFVICLENMKTWRRKNYFYDQSFSKMHVVPGKLSKISSWRQNVKIDADYRPSTLFPEKERNINKKRTIPLFFPLIIWQTPSPKWLNFWKFSKTCYIFPKNLPFWFLHGMAWHGIGCVLCTLIIVIDLH